ncbi:MAG: hypothetical protein R3266_07330 [Gemmatimonadota bacterium]|nr:hypothetical protein [Gemmatimonadota bacterium]
MARPFSGDPRGTADATLSIGIGPVFFPSAVTAALAVPGSVTAVVAIGLVGALLAIGRRHGRPTGATLITLYLGVYYAMLA